MQHHKSIEYHCKELKQRFLEQRYNSELLNKHIKTVQKLDRNELIIGNKKGTTRRTHIPLAITYNRFLPNTSKIIREKWKIISVNESLKQFLKRTSYIFKMKQKFQGTHRQQPNRK